MEKQLIWREKKLHYALNGWGPAVVLLHPYLASHRVWDSLTEVFKDQFTVVAVDLPGFGQSDVFAESHSMSFMAEAVKAVMDHENIVKAVMVGHSMGGYMSLAFAEQFPDRLNGLVLFHSQAAADTPEARENRMRSIEVVKNGHKNYSNKFLPDLFADENKVVLADQIQSLCKEAENISPEGIIAVLRGMAERKDYRLLLKRLNIPVLFVAGKNDPRIPLDVITQQMQMPRDSEAILIDNVGHMGQFEAPDKIFPVLESFCERAHIQKGNK
ncbi:MAG: alpha/beta hydrolase [Bacteroidales bacterium]|nr:alpha/beta hydrolase [Bacteroidales bacterium]